MLGIKTQDRNILYIFSVVLFFQNALVVPQKDSVFVRGTSAKNVLKGWMVYLCHAGAVPAYLPVSFIFLSGCLTLVASDLSGRSGFIALKESRPSYSA